MSTISSASMYAREAAGINKTEIVEFLAKLDEAEEQAQKDQDYEICDQQYTSPPQFYGGIVGFCSGLYCISNAINKKVKDIPISYMLAFIPAAITGALGNSVTGKIFDTPESRTKGVNPIIEHGIKQLDEVRFRRLRDKISVIGVELTKDNIGEVARQQLTLAKNHFETTTMLFERNLTVRIHSS